MQAKTNSAHQPWLAALIVIAACLLAAAAPPDGYTILLHHTSLAFNVTFYHKLPYDAVKDLAPPTPPRSAIGASLRDDLHRARC